MKSLDIRPYCDDCCEFEPRAITGTFFGEDKVLHVNTVITCCHAETVKNALRYCAGVFDGEECNACDYEGCTTELMLDAAHSIDHLLEKIHDLAQEKELALRAVDELSSDIEK